MTRLVKTKSSSQLSRHWAKLRAATDVSKLAVIVSDTGGAPLQTVWTSSVLGLLATCSVQFSVHPSTLCYWKHLPHTCTVCWGVLEHLYCACDTSQHVYSQSRSFGGVAMKGKLADTFFPCSPPRGNVPKLSCSYDFLEYGPTRLRYQAAASSVAHSPIDPHPLTASRLLFLWTELPFESSSL